MWNNIWEFLTNANSQAPHQTYRFRNPPGDSSLFYSLRTLRVSSAREAKGGGPMLLSPLMSLECYPTMSHSLAPSALQQKWCLLQLPHFANLPTWLIPHRKHPLSMDLDMWQPPSTEDGDLSVYQAHEDEAGGTSPWSNPPQSSQKCRTYQCCYSGLSDASGVKRHIL